MRPTYSRLYLLDDGKDVGGEGVRGLPVCRHPFSLCIPEVSAVSQNGAQCLSRSTDDDPFVNVLKQLSRQTGGVIGR